MENRVENSDDVEIPKKTRSLDLQSLYKSRMAKECKNNKILKRKRSLEGGDDGDGEGERKKKKRKSSRKEVSLSSFEHVGKKNKKSLDEVYSGGGLSPGSHDSDKTQLGLRQKLDKTSSNELSQKLNSIALSLDDNVIRIPKRRRGFARRKKFEGNQVLKLAGPSSSKAGVVDRVTKLTGDSATRVDSGTRVESSKVKRKKGFDDFKENKSSVSNGSNSAWNFKEEDGNSVAYNGDSSSRKPRKNRRKRKDLALDGQSSVKEAEPSVDKSIKICDDLQEEDEENLEQNAARMLSSRFDPSCTGFSSNRKASGSLLTNGLSLLMSSGRDFVSRRRSSLAGSESVSVDAAGRVLRPRKQHNEKGFSRKRRHFYEILSGDLDAYWVLNRRIKVFWPLDQSWYFGLVSDYDPDRKLHHVKYDDRDEEWINLQNERFKLLLLPSEVPGKADNKSSVMVDKCAERGKGDVTTEDDSYMGSYMDSEPIISWLARSTRRVKSSPFGAMKKQKTSSQSRNLVPPLLSNRTVNAHGRLDAGSSKRDKNKLSRNSALPDRSNDAGRGEKSVLESTYPKDKKLPIVYFRRRFRQRGQEPCHISEDDRVCRIAPESIASLAPVVDRFGFLEEYDISLGRSDHDGPFWCIDNSGLLKLTIPLIESRPFRFKLSFPVLPVLNYSSGVENFWLFRTFLLLQYGTVMIMWPKVHLEMLFVDNIVGLRFFLFEGCLKQAVAFVFLVLTVFHQPAEQGKYFDLQVPVTSIRFKLSYVEDLRKQLVFAFYSFSKMKSSKWLYLDCKLKRHCLLSKHLPLSECTYDNIKALQSGTNQLLVTSVCGEPSSTEVLQKRSRQGIIHKGVSKESASVNMSQSSSKEKHIQLPPFSLSFTAAPTFFLSLHLKLLMEHSLAHISFPDHDSMSLLEHAEKSGSLMADDHSLVEDCSNKGSEITPGNSLRTSFRDAVCSGWSSCANPEVGTDAFSVRSVGDPRKPSWKYQNGDLNGAGTSASSQDPGNNGIDCIVQLQKWQCHHSESEQLSPRPLVLRDLSSPGKSDSGCYSCLNGISVEIPPFNQVEDPVNGGTQSAHRSTDLGWKMNDGLIRSPNPTAPRSACHRNRNSSSSLPFGQLSHGPDGKAEFCRNGFGSGPRKPRTQVSYTLPLGGFDFSSKDRSHQQKGLSHKRIRRANEKRTLDGSRSSQRNLELLSCDANVLITLGDRGWRECGARVVLEFVDHNEWRLAVKLSGTTKYSYKAHQFLQPGSTNRYTHAMMWKGGKDWILEFPDRSQWTLFKEMHEECYNRNIRAALVKNIPIPGVRLIEESDDNGTEVAFVRSSPKYFRQVESDVEMALDRSRILYDMDSDDEQWMLKNRNSSEINKSGEVEISEELFEKTMDMFEKVAYDEQRDQFTSDEIDELMDGVGPMDVIKTIHEHWRQRRQRKGMALIRQLQPPLWEMYQQQVREWELAMTKTNCALSNGFQEKAAANEKPPMFAFCLKPRGLEVPNKGSKQRSQRRFPVAGQSYAILGEQDGYHAFGRRLNGFAFGEEKVIFPGHSHDSSDVSPLLQTSTRVFSPRDTASTGDFSMSSDGFERNHYPKLNRTKSKKIGTFLSSNDPQMVAASYNQRTIGKRNGVQRWNMGLPEWPSQKNYQSEGSQRHGIEQLDGSDLDEFRLRDASGAAQHALNMAKLKREKSQRLLYRADLAIHKAVVALMTAEAIKASSEDINGDG